MVTQSNGRPLKTVERAFKILDLLYKNDGATPSEVFEMTELSRSAVYNYLTTLVKSGYVIQDGSTYNLSFRFLHLGQSVRLRVNGFRFIERAISDLTSETNEEVDFVVLDNGRITPIAESYHYRNHYYERSQMPVEFSGIGSYFFMHATASGKALLAEHSDEYVREVIDKWGLPAQTEYTITDRTDLIEELDKIRERGYAITDEEFTEGNRSIAMTVIDDGEPIGALSITGPTYRFQEDTLRDCFPSLLKEQIEQIEANLGS
jgi:DNA-binding IclR family transcriptional regulator